MKSIILNPHELRNIDQLKCVVRPVKEKSPDGREMSYVDRTDADPTLFEIGFTMSDCVVRTRSPFSPGETAWVKETYNGNQEVGVCYKATEPDMDGCPWRSAHSMPQWASRYEITFRAVVGKQVEDVTFEDVQLCGMNVNDHVVSYNQELEDIACDGSGDTEHVEEMAVKEFCGLYKCTPDTWLWLWTVEVKKI